MRGWLNYELAKRDHTILARAMFENMASAMSTCRPTSLVSAATPNFVAARVKQTSMSAPKKLRD
jgi:hypothetical protein